ncbi:cyclic lactone autoinducer peptide [Agathobacter rectalis]|uniref:Cyclic lactone autoinducer peptide n=1 Tax=Agathobacter rectalis TaxID=39491 RepID=A0A413M4B7_9FIRM|nr:cyclic lactone autoinducer peptide [Agathobacter rectalis]RGZ74364.1 cyclic lactone autoinducer peptide [Agathobacter rectalis]
MKKLNDVALKLLAKAAYANAEKEANSACIMNMVIDNF